MSWYKKAAKSVGGAIVGGITGGPTGAVDGAVAGLKSGSSKKKSSGSSSGGVPEESASSLMEAASGYSIEYGKAMIKAQEEATERAIQRNIERFPQLTDLAGEETISTANLLNDFMKQEFESTLDELYPEWRTEILGAAQTAQGDSIALTQAFKENVLPKAMAAADEMSVQALSNVSAMLRGDLPPDVAAQLQRHAAEVAQQIGVRGQAAQYLTARDLGRTSYDMMQAGLAAAPAALALGSGAYAAFNQTLQAPVTTGMNITNLLSAYKAPMVDPQSLYGAHLGVVSSAGLVPAGTAMATNAQMVTAAGQLASNMVQFGAEYQSQQYWNQQNLSLQQQALKEQERANTLQFITGIIQGGAKLAGGLA